MSLKIILANHIILVNRFFKNMLITETAVTPEMIEEFAKYNLRNFAHDYSYSFIAVF